MEEDEQPKDAHSEEPSTPLPGPLPSAASPPPSSSSYVTYGSPFQFRFDVGISTHSSQLPSGPDLERIEGLLPGATDRLLAMQEQVGNMAEREQLFQHEMGRDNSRRKTNGQRYAFLAFLICMGITIWAAAAGHDVVAEVVGGTTVVGVVGIFVAGRVLHDEEGDEPPSATPSN